jgi:two-component system sensor histidine kinase HydH
LVLATGAVAALAVSLGLAYAGVRDAEASVERGEADVFVRAVQSRLLALGRPFASSDAEAFLEDHRVDGLVYVGLFAPDGRVVVEAGVPRGDRSEDRAEGGLRGIGSVRRMVITAGLAPPGPGRGRTRPPPGHPEDPPPGFRPPGPPMPPPPRIVVEFEPRVAPRLAAQTRRTIVAGGVVGAAVLLFALLFVRSLRQRELLRDRLERERRLAALGEMSAVLAHEIRNPLASLKGHAQLLEESLPEGTGDRDKAGRVVREAVRLERLTSDLLQFVRTGSIDRRETDPAALLREAVEEAGADRIDLRVDGAPPVWPLDADRLRQALSNLLRNAVQAGGEGSRVAAEATVDGGRLWFVVRDRGEGIPPGERERVFEPFHTTRVRGTGLGLAVARRVVEAHGGTIEVRDREGGGAEFRVGIPRGTTAA